MILAGTTILVVTMLIFGGKSTSKPKQQQQTQQVEQPNNTQVQPTLKNTTDWKSINEPTITDIAEYNCTVTVSGLTVYGKKTTGEDISLEVKAEISGTIIVDGAFHAGTCTIEIPYKFVAPIQQRLNDGQDLRLNATCKTGKVDGLTIVYDVELIE